ncbi:TetR/AcrR family transcriptional regulator [Aerococcaceae bacterium WGS1372]
METKLDPRIVRSRQAIIDAFITLSEAKPLESITVKNITDKALINRATFYNHFLDKYDLMEKAIMDVVQINLNRDRFTDIQLDDNYILEIFNALCTLHTNIENQCQRSYHMIINQLVMDQIEVIHAQKLKEIYTEIDEATINRVSKFFASGMFTLSRDWKEHASDEEPNHHIEGSIAFMKSLMNADV